METYGPPPSSAVNGDFPGTFWRSTGKPLGGALPHNAPHVYCEVESK